MPDAVANQNSYASDPDADAYLDASVSGASWAELDPDSQARALISSTRLLERQRWEGTVTTLSTVASAAIAAGGTGHAKGDILTAQGVGPVSDRKARVLVTSVLSGVVTGISLIDAGLYTTLPSPLTGVSTTSDGAGTGCTLNLTAGAQLLAFPRTGLTDRYGADPGSTTVPTEIEQACIELANLLSQDPSLDGQGNTAQTTPKRVKAGSVEVEQFAPGAFVPITRFPPNIMELIGPYLATSAGLVLGSEAFGTDAESQFDSCDISDFSQPLG